MGRRRAIIEDMAEMTTAAAAMHFGTDHAMAAIHRGLNRPRLGIVEARPAGAAFELFPGSKQGLIASRAIERAGALLVIERTTAGPFGRVMTKDLILLGAQQATPLFVGMRDSILLI